MRVCSGPGCLRAVPDDERFCDECKPTHRVEDGIRSHNLADRERYQFLYESNRFQDYCRPKTLKTFPFCARCGSAPSTICDHIVPAGEAVRQVKESGRFPFDLYAGFFLLSNLQGLCRVCHSIKTNEDKAHVGPWPSVLDKQDALPKKVWRF